MPLNGTFPYYSDGVVGEKYGDGHYKATNGRLYKVSTSGAGTPLAWYPAPGYRYPADGVQRNVGNSGDGWSSTVGSTNGVYLSFNVMWMNPGYTNRRTHGFPLRCLSE